MMTNQVIIDETITNETIVTETITRNPSGLRDTASAARREALLHSGRAWEEHGMINSAIDSYFLLLRLYRGSLESREASERLISIGRIFELQGHFHEALSLLDKVEKLA